MLTESPTVKEDPRPPSNREIENFRQGRLSCTRSLKYSSSKICRTRYAGAEGHPYSRYGTKEICREGLEVLLVKLKFALISRRAIENGDGSHRAYLVQTGWPGSSHPTRLP